MQDFQSGKVGGCLICSKQGNKEDTILCVIVGHKISNLLNVYILFWYKLTSNKM